MPMYAKVCPGCQVGERARVRNPTLLSLLKGQLHRERADKHAPFADTRFLSGLEVVSFWSGPGGAGIGSEWH